MNVKLVSLTKPVIFVPRSDSSDPVRQMSSEELIVYTARVSNPANQANTETAPRLLAYLIKNRHWSPFEMVSMTLEIETSRAIATQILRHRSFSFQEFSQRYADAGQMGFETYEARRQDQKNRQNSIDDMDETKKTWFHGVQMRVQEEAARDYRMAIALGIAKEQARMLLPLSTSTKLYMAGTIRSWIHYFQARLNPATQAEHRNIALDGYRIFKVHFPTVAAALDIVSAVPEGA